MHGKTIIPEVRTDTPELIVGIFTQDIWYLYCFSLEQATQQSPVLASQVCYLCWARGIEPLKPAQILIQYNNNTNK